MQAYSPMMAIGGNLIRGLGGLQAGNAARKQADRQAREISRVGLAQEQRVRDQARKTIGKQVAAQFSNGFHGGTGSALDYLLESQVNAELDAMNVRRETQAKAMAVRSEGRSRQNAGRWSLLEGLFGAGQAVAGMRDDWAQAGRGLMPGDY